MRTRNEDQYSKIIIYIETGKRKEEIGFRNKRESGKLKKMKQHHHVCTHSFGH
jgi:hypothetical protein